ncbi:MAG TPA: host attachment protein [Opitutaceae bacterium]|nr:host attachment protein [Opitutaceae bacterium]
MPSSSEDPVAARARQLWEQQGRPAGRDLDIWLQAERELREPESVPLPVDGPAVSNLDRTLPPGEKRRVRAARHGGGPAQALASVPAPDHFVVILDRAHLRVYQMREEPGVLREAQFELAESIDFPSGRRRYTDQDSDQAGRFGAMGQTGGSIDERLPMQEEHQRRVLADLAHFIDVFLDERPHARWDLAAGPALHHALVQSLRPGVRARLRQSLVKDLVHQSPAELRAHFGRNG